MSFARRNALLPRGAFLIPAILLGVAAIVFLIRILFPGFFITLVTPFWRFSSFTSGLVGGATSSLQNLATLSRELDVARAENAALTSENDTLSGQVHDLQNLLGSRTAPPKGVLASVLARPPESPYDTLIVDEGEASGVVPGALVTGPGGSPLGRVASLTTSTARVVLFSASREKTDAWVGTGRVPITLNGAGGGTFTATAPKDAKLATGDVVYVLGGAALGTVVRVDTDPSSATATLRIQSIINPFTLIWVTLSKSL
jgi:cell shape-determining protein MreC